MEDWKLEPARDLGLPLGQRVRSLHRECGLIETAAHLVWWRLLHLYFRLGHRLTVRGRENVPDSLPFILVANHASHLDALVLSCPLPWRCRDHVFAVAAGDTFFEKPVTAAFAAGVLNALPLWRKKAGPKALLDLRRRLLEEPCGYVLFPEGTRSRDGTMGRFKGGLGMLVAETAVPVVPCYLDGTFAALPPSRKVPAFRPITITIGTPLEFSQVKNEQTGWKEVAARAEAAVRALAPT
jgi:1-acyl-sn-glycerol-3-phosphate acyltransferase